MPAHLKLTLLLIGFFIPVQLSLAQHVTKDNYTGAWTNPNSWNPAWLNPTLNSVSETVTINGFITANGSLTLNGTANDLIINDTLIIEGTLTLGNNNRLIVNDYGILIIRGDLAINNQTGIAANGYLVVTNVLKIGSLIQGTFTSNDNPVKVFIGGSVAAELTNNVDYPVLNSVSPPTTPYPNSNASYGNAADLMNNPIYSFFQASCPAISASGISPVCQGQSIQLNATGGKGFSWTGPDSFASVLQNPSITGALPSMGGVYTVFVTPFTGCTGATKTVNIVVNPSPTVNIGSNSPLCAGSNIILTSSGGNTYSWIGPRGFLSSVANPSIPDAKTNMSGNYFVTVTDANNCSAASSVNVTVNPIPVATILGTSPVCAGNTINLTSSGGTSYGWTGPNSFTSLAQSPVILNSTTSMSGTYTVTVTDANNCVASKTVNITVNPLPVVNISANSPVCAGNNISLTSSGGISYSWAGPINFSSSVQNPSITNAQPNMSGTYSVTVTDANSCVSNKSVNITINPLPVVSISSNSPLCAGQTLSLSASGDGIFNWTGPGGFTSTVSNPSIQNSSISMSGDYTVTVTNQYNCSSNARQSVTVQPTPEATLTTNSPLCAGSTINLSASGGNTYSWVGPAGFASTAANTSIGNATAGMTGMYVVTVTGANGCSVSPFANVVVNDVPNVGITVSDKICINDQVALTGSPGGGIFRIVSGPGSLNGNNLSASEPGLINLEYVYSAACSNKAVKTVQAVNRPKAFAGEDQHLKFVFETDMKAVLSENETGRWTLLSGSAVINDESSPVSRIRDLAVGENSFSWTVTNGICSEVSLVKINVDDLFVPSVITPNGDGKNDTFIINALIGPVKLTIFNKWGNEEYRSSDYANEWDGRNNKGDQLTEDTYYYIITLGNGTTRKGTVLVMR